MEGTPTDASVIQRSLADPECFGTIFDRHLDAIHAYLARRAGRDTADALAGEVFRVAFEARVRYRSDLGSALPWLYGIASNVLRQHRRTEFRQARVKTKLSTLRHVNFDLGDVAETMQLSDDVNAVVDALRTLPDIEREAILLFAWEELSYEQIAQALELPVGTVRSRLHRARTRIREQIQAGGQVLGEPTRGADRRCRP